jgi:hypothetical protein
MRTLYRRARARLTGVPWYRHEGPYDAPDGAYCPRCNYYTDKPWKFYTGCHACDERGEG